MIIDLIIPESGYRHSTNQYSHDESSPLHHAVSSASSLRMLTSYHRRALIGTQERNQIKTSVVRLLSVQFEPSSYIQWTQHAPAEAVQQNEAYAYYANELCVTSRMAECEVAAVNAHYTLIP